MSLVRRVCGRCAVQWSMASYVWWVLSIFGASFVLTGCENGNSDVQKKRSTAESTVAGSKRQPEKETSQGSVQPLCSLFEKRVENKKYKMSGKLHGCPLWVDSVDWSALSEKSRSVDPATIKKILQRSEDEAVSEVKLALIAERAGFLERPDVQKKVLRMIGNLYVQDARLNKQISEQDKKSYFEENKGEFDMPDMRFGRHVMFKITDDQTEQSARDKAMAFYRQHAYQKMESGDFAALAAQLSEDQTTSWQGGLLPVTAKEGDKMKVDASLAEALFDLSEPGMMTKPVKSSQGWHIIYYAREVKGITARYEDVQNIIHMRMEKDQFQEIVDREAKKYGL